MNITITIEWMTVVRIACAVTWCMVIYYFLFYDHGKSE